MARLFIHPGEHLADELESLGMSANQLAKELGVPTNRITEIIRGNASVANQKAGNILDLSAFSAPLR